MVLLGDGEQLFQPDTHRLDVIGLDKALKHEVAIVIQFLALGGSQQVQMTNPYLTKSRGGNDGFTTRTQSLPKSSHRGDRI
jgi:hypothetical protein